MNKLNNLNNLNNLNKQLFININNTKININIDSELINLTEIIRLTNKKIKDNCNNNNISSDDYYFIYNGKLLNNKSIINITTNNNNNNSQIICNSKLKGGIIDAIIDMLAAIVNFLKNAVPLLEEVIMLFDKLIAVIFTLFSPDKFINDVLYGSTAGIKLIFSSFLGSINSDLVSDSSKKNTSGGSGPFGVNEESKAGNKAICIPPTLTNILFLIVCPPLALLLHRGVKGMFQIILCALMTYYLYYFPGFIYAALHILC
jgi:uncharacterized membrane protein YqaE (UPF0057 family)